MIVEQKIKYSGEGIRESTFTCDSCFIPRFSLLEHVRQTDRRFKLMSGHFVCCVCLHSEVSRP